MLASRSDEAVETGREALALAEELGLRELQAHALTNIGTARAAAGDAQGYADLERAYEIARSIRSGEALRALGNHASLLGDMGDLNRERVLYMQVVDLAEELGVSGFGLWTLPEVGLLDFKAGRWDEAVAVMEKYLATKGGAHYLESVARSILAEVLVGRGDEARGIAQSAGPSSSPAGEGPAESLPDTRDGGQAARRGLGRTKESERLLAELAALLAERALPPTDGSST